MISYSVVIGLLLGGCALGYASLKMSTARIGAPLDLCRTGERIWFIGCGCSLVAAVAIMAALNYLDGHHP